MSAVAPITGMEFEARYWEDADRDPMCVSDGKPVTSKPQVDQPMCVKPIPLDQLLNE